MSIGSVKKKINAKTLLGQSSALRENSETLKKGVKKLAKILTERKKIRPSTLMATEEPEVVEQKRIGPGEYDKPEGGGFPFGPLLAGLGALGAAVGLAALDPGMFLKRFARASLKALNLMEKPVEGVPWPPEIVLTPSGWEASLIWNSNLVIIRKDGKVWVK